MNRYFKSYLKKGGEVKNFLKRKKNEMIGSEKKGGYGYEK